MTDLQNHLGRYVRVPEGPWTMGRYGTIRLGLKFPERYAHSAAFRVEEVVAPLGPAIEADVDGADLSQHAEAVATWDQCG